MKTAAYVLISGILWNSILGNNCPYKECYCFGDDISCDDRYLKAMPQRIENNNPNTAALNLDRNQITTIPAGSLPGNLSDISIQMNPIETIDDTAFDDSANTLQTLTFFQARFTQVPKALLHLNVLKTLSIYDTHILVWDDEDMKQIGSTLETFVLDTVGLTSWPTWIQSYSHLTELAITGGSISSLPDDALDMVTNTLTSLYLSNNSLTSVPYALSKLTALTTLALELNRIRDITWLPQLSKLLSLSLSNNRLSNTTSLTNSLRVHAGTITDFDIHNNLLTSIPDLDFLIHVTSLDFSYNVILNPTSGSIPLDLSKLNLDYNLLPNIPRVLKSLNYVPYLTVRHNHVHTIQGSDFPGWTTGIDLGYNLITELTDTSFPQSSKITSILLSFNPLSYISPRAFQTVPRLQELNLQHSRLTRMPLALLPLTTLQMLDVSDIRSLVCTCMEKSLEPRIKSMMSNLVIGNCGLTSVYTFFTQLSPNCPPLP